MIQAGGYSQVLGRRSVTVWVKPTPFGAWTYAPWLEPLVCTKRAMPGGSSARFRWRYGRHMDPRVGAWAVYDPVDLDGWWVQVVLHDQWSSVVMWTGIVVMHSDQMDGGAWDGIERGSLEFDAFGPEYLLRQYRAWGAWTEGGVYIDRTPPVNRRTTRGLHVEGNMSAGLSALGTWTFSTQGAEWTHYKFLHYVMHLFQNDGITWYFAGDAWVLDQMRSSFEYEGLTVLELLDRLIGGSNGLGWGVRYHESGACVIDVWSQVEYPLSTGTFTLPANTRQTVLWDTDPLLQPRVMFSSDTRYDQIIVGGEPIKVMSSHVLAADAGRTLGYGGNLVPGWTPAQQALYKAADDDERREAKYDAVYTTWVLPPDYDWAGLNCLVGADGSVVSSEVALPRNWNEGHRFERYLPVTQVGADGEAEWRPASVFVHTQEDGWHEIQNLVGIEDPVDDFPAVGVRLLDQRPGVYLKSRIANHHIALGMFEGDTDYNPVINPIGSVVTVFHSLDQRIAVRAALPTGYGPGAKPLVLYIPDAEFWWAYGAPIIDTVGGELQGYTGPQIIRDDRARLYVALSLAMAMYGRPRRPIEAYYGTLVPGFELGTLILGVSNGLRWRDSGTTVTEIEWDCEGMQMRLRTGGLEMDITRLAGGLR